MKAGSKRNRATAKFVARGNQDIQRFIALVGLGMCRAMAAGAVTAEYACHRLFGPAVMSRARQARAAPELLEALHLASELVDVERLVPHAYEASLADVEARLVASLQELSLGFSKRGNLDLRPGSAEIAI